jgi:hypothetical protein
LNGGFLHHQSRAVLGFSASTSSDRKPSTLSPKRVG